MIATPMRRFLLSASLSLLVVATAQSQTPTIPTAADSVFARARQLVERGNGAAGRLLVDSMLTVAIPDTPAYGEALYWRATFATTSADAERDFRTVIVDYPLSPRTGDALLQLSNLEIARGDRQAAITHLDRFLLENPRHAERNRAGMSLVRLQFDQNELQRGCIVLGRTLREIPPDNVELRNQLDYFSPRCAGVDTNRVVAAVDTVVKPDATKPAAGKATTAKTTPPKTSNTKPSATKPSTAKPAAAKPEANVDSAAAPPPKPAGRFTLQVAAYSSRDLAESLANKLRARDLDARVVPGENPTRFRVRIGRYATRAAATAAQKQIKATKVVNEVNVIEAGPDDK